MKDTHLTLQEIRDLLENDDTEIRNRLLLHHLAICPECYGEAGHILDLHHEGWLADGLCTTELELAKSRKEARAPLEELLRRSTEEQKALIPDTARFKSWGLAELLCLRSEEEAAGDPKRSQDLAKAAVAVAETLDEWEPAEKHWLYLLRGYCAAHLGNALRVQGDFRGAEEAFTTANLWWAPAFADVGDVLGYEARFLAFKASLRRDERHFEEALSLIEEALEAHPAPSLRLKILINKAKTYEEMGDLEMAIEVLGAARAEAGEGEGDPRVRLCLEQNRLDYLSKAERYMEAKLALADVAALGRELGTELDALRLRWTEARIARGLGDTEGAIALLKEIHKHLVAEGLLYDSALLSLELALIFKESRRPAETREWVASALPILSALSVEREALAALSLLTSAVEEERITAELVSQALDVFRRAKR